MSDDGKTLDDVLRRTKCTGHYPRVYLNEKAVECYACRKQLARRYAKPQPGMPWEWETTDAGEQICTAFEVPATKTPVCPYCKSEFEEYNQHFPQLLRPGVAKTIGCPHCGREYTAISLVQEVQFRSLKHPS